MSFLPSAPKQSSAVSTLAEAPVVTANPYLSESAYLKPNVTIPPKPSQVDIRIRRADERFADGRRLFTLGDLSAARAEFDAAVDILLGTPENLPDRYKVDNRLEHLVAEIHRYDVNRLGAGDLSTDPAYDKAPLEDILDMTFPSTRASLQGFRNNSTPLSPSFHSRSTMPFSVT